jgi:hypothetical protein
VVPCRFNEATQLFKKVLSITDQNIRLDGAVLALNSLADMAATQADFIAAENYLQDALKILQYKFKAEHEKNASVADQFILLAELKTEQHLFESAKECYESALSIQKLCFGDIHISVAHTLDCLADLFSDRGEQTGAERYRVQSSVIYNELQQIRDKQESSDDTVCSGSSSDKLDGTSLSLVGHTHVPVYMSASALHDMVCLLSDAETCTGSGADTGSGGNTLTFNGVTDSAEPLQFHARALNILTSQYGKNHPRVALALMNLAKVLSKKGKKSEALSMVEIALGILRKVHGENHPHVAAAVHNLGKLKLKVP